MSKIIKLVKENKIISFALLIVALTFALLAIPGFAHSDYFGGEWKYKLSGYQTFFNTEYTVATVLETKVLNGTCGAGIAAFVMLILTFVALFFSKKSSFVTLMSGLSLLTISVLFFSMEASVLKIVKIQYEEHASCGWVTYFIGALLIIAAGLVIYKSIMMMKDEVKHPTAKKSGPTYSYLK